MNKIRDIEEIIEVVTDRYIEVIDKQIEEEFIKGKLRVEVMIPKILYDLEEIREGIGEKIEEAGYSINGVKTNEDGDKLITINIIEEVR